MYLNKAYHCLIKSINTAKKKIFKFRMYCVLLEI